MQPIFARRNVLARQTPTPGRSLPLSLLLLGAALWLGGCGGGGGGSLDSLDGGELPEGAVCFEGAVQCTPDSSGVQTCVGGQWGTAMACAFGCNGGVCLGEAIEGTCPTPIELTLGEPASSTTSGGLAAHSWSETCTVDYGYEPTGPEKVFRFALTEPGSVSVDLTAGAQTYYGVYLRASCGDPGELGGACAGSGAAGGSVALDYLLPAGEYYVLVDDFGANGEGPGAFTLSVTPSAVPSCHGQVPTVLDLSSGTATVEGDTAQGQSAAVWHSPQCAIIQESRGQEQIYAFSVAEPVTLVAQATAIEPSPSRIALYLRTECETDFSQVACGYVDDMSSGPASITTDLEPGTYFLFVDDFPGSIDDPQTYTLSVDVMPR